MVQDGGEPVKIYFELDANDWHGAGSESLWGRPIVGSPDRTIIELLNTPFLAKSVSYRDVVEAVDRNGPFGLSRVARRGGRSTDRILVPPTDVASPSFRQRWGALADLGCTYEGADIRGMKLLAVDVPPTAIIDSVFALLERAEFDGLWTFEEGHLGHSFRD